MAAEALTFVMKPFEPNSKKAKDIESEVDKAAGKANEDDKEDEDTQSIDTTVKSAKVIEVEQQNESEELRKELTEILKEGKKLTCLVNEFEKDEDSNCHIDFIHACANIRSANYTLESMDWINTKLKAGRIVPALATTTACVSGLQTIELIKMLKGVDVDIHRNSTLNLALPMLMMAEPAPPGKTTIRKGFEDFPEIETTVWDRWEVKATSNEFTLAQVIAALTEKYKLAARDVFLGAIPLFLYALRE